MNFPWFQLFLNFLLLGAALFVCKTLNASTRESKWNGALIFIGFCLLAMTLDFMLTQIFASATSQERASYITLASMPAWTERVIAYLIPCAWAAVLAVRFRHRSNSQRARPVTIKTSDYTQSELSV